MEATVTDIMKLLGMSASDFMKEWKSLPDDYKAWYKKEASKELGYIK